MTANVTPEQVAAVSKLGTIVSDGHTHAGDVDVIPIDRKNYSSANQLSSQDISIYTNILIETNGKKWTTIMVNLLLDI